MKEIANVNERLIVAADFELEGNDVQAAINVRQKVLQLADALHGTGVIIKVNSILRAGGYSLVEELHERGLKVMADLKLVDIPQTMKIDGQLLACYKPEIVTVMANAGIDGLSALVKAMPATQVLAVTVLTSLDEEECQQIYCCSTKAGVLRFARMAQAAGCAGLVLSPKEVDVIRKRPALNALSLNTPGIRPTFGVVKGDDQKRTDTPEAAFLAGVDRIVVGRPITQAENPQVAVQLILEEIKVALEKKEKK
ncbi:MAG: orotidine-5'-phosphate decarboxylase [Candidatus Parcubacteria bacterium]|nr:orotidine-5'-phosphate decarboxylase [Candidatus Parcubacteria bacterium]